MTRAEKRKVYLVGAGPGDPELLTMRAVRLLETAEIVFHDDLVSQQVLALVQPDAQIQSVGKRCGRPTISQAEIHVLMIEAASAGKSVVRLKSGDPLVFGRAGEEIAALRGAGISFEVVPGITAALAAGAMLGVPLTDRKSSSKLILCTGHHATEKHGSPIWEGPLPMDAMLVVYMPGRDLGRIAQELSAAGMQPSTPCCAISHVATKEQSYSTCKLAELPELVCGPAPLLLLIGGAMEPLPAVKHAHSH
jgi:uroporphyrin-III C-methyltransferase